MKEQLDFIAIGDITTDCFIRLAEPSAHTDLDHHTRELCMEFGAKIPYESVTVVPAVGNAANAAVCAAKLGLNAALVTNQGDDANGDAHLLALERARIETRFVKTHRGKATNYHYVLWFGSERTILIRHEKYEYRMPKLANPAWVYLSSLADHTESFHHDVAAYIEKHPRIKLAFQPGTFQIKLGTHKLAALYRRSDAFFSNLEEAKIILKTDERDVIKLLFHMADLGPRIVVITDGRAGAHLYDGTRMWHMPLYPDPRPPFERTGAGDAYAATFVSALGLGLSPVEALRWAPVNSMSVVQKIGAQAGLLSRTELEALLLTAPKSYRPRLID